MNDFKKVEIYTRAYNPKRYGRPWIAQVVFKHKPAGEFFFGEWIGDPGHEGILLLDVQPGFIVCQGQKDFRRAVSNPSWYRVNKAFQLVPIESKAAAYMLSQIDDAIIE